MRIHKTKFDSMFGNNIQGFILMAETYHFHQLILVVTHIRHQAQQRVVPAVISA